MVLYIAFKKETPLENLLHAFFNISKEMFERTGKYASENSIKGYYYDLLYTALEIGLPYLMTPHEYCHEYYQDEEDLCIGEIATIGCEEKKPDPPYRSPDTELYTDEELMNAISRGVGDRNISDEDVMEDLSDEHLMREYERYWRRRKFNNERPRYRRHRNLQCALYETRYSRYGIYNLSFADICQEYNRRQNTLVKKPFDNYYVLYLHDTIKNCDIAKLKDRTEYCKELLRDQKNSQLQ